MESAMESVQDKYNFQVRWQPFLLRPDMPPEGIAKAPDTAGNPRVGDHLKKAGEKVGIIFTGKCDRYPNTLAAHALLEHVLKKYGPQKQNQLAEVIFNGYFTDGLYPDPKNLAKLAAGVGIDKSEAEKVAKNENSQHEAREQARDWKRKGCNSIPLFFMNGRRTFNGAQDEETFVKMFHLAAGEDSGGPSQGEQSSGKM